jgi:hypothetical protein
LKIVGERNLVLFNDPGKELSSLLLQLKKCMLDALDEESEKSKHQFKAMKRSGSVDSPQPKGGDVNSRPELFHGREC